MKPTLILIILTTLIIYTTGHAQTRPSPANAYQTPPDTYEEHKLISDNLYLVSKNQFKNIRHDRWYGLVDSVGNIIIPCIYNQITYLTDDLIFVQRKPPYFDIYDRTGRLKEQTEHIVLPAKTKDNKHVIIADPLERKFALMNQKGKIVTPFKAKLDMALPRPSNYYSMYFATDYFEKGSAKLAANKTSFRLLGDIYRRYYQLTSKNEGERTIHFKRADGEAWQVKQPFKWVRNKRGGYHSNAASYFYLTFSEPIVNINCPHRIFKKLKKDKSLFEHEVIYHDYNLFNGQFKAHHSISKLADLPLLDPIFKKRKERIDTIRTAIQQSLELLPDTDFKFMPQVIINHGSQFIFLDFGYIKDHIGKIILTDEAWYFQPNESIRSPNEVETPEDVVLIQNMPTLDAEERIQIKSFIVYYGKHQNIYPQRDSFFMKWVK